MKTGIHKKRLVLVKRIVMTMLVFCLAVPIAFIASPVTVFAADPEEEEEGDDFIPYIDLEDEIGKGHAGINLALAKAFCFATTSLTGQNMTEALKWSDIDLVIAKQIWELLMPLGVGMAIVYFLIEMNHAVFMASNNWTMQTLISPILKFGVCIAVCQYGNRFVSKILGFGNWFVDKASGFEPYSYGLSRSFCEAIKALGFIECCLIFVIGILYVIVGYIISLIFLYKAISYKIEVLIRVAITPIVFGDVWDGRNSNAVRWLKKLGGLVLYGGCFILIMRIGLAITTGDVIKGMLGAETSDSAETTKEVIEAMVSDIWGLLKGIVMALVVPIAEIGALSAAKQACMEVF